MRCACILLCVAVGIVARPAVAQSDNQPVRTSEPLPTSLRKCPQHREALRRVFQNQRDASAWRALADNLDRFCAACGHVYSDIAEESRAVTRLLDPEDFDTYLAAPRLFTAGRALWRFEVMDAGLVRLLEERSRALGDPTAERVLQNFRHSLEHRQAETAAGGNQRSGSDERVASEERARADAYTEARRRRELATIQAENEHLARRLLVLEDRVAAERRNAGAADRLPEGDEGHEAEPECAPSRDRPRHRPPQVIYRDLTPVMRNRSRQMRPAPLSYEQMHAFWVRQVGRSDW